MQPASFKTGDEILDALCHPCTVTGFSDAGAHVSQQYGATRHIFLLSCWVREKQVFTLEEAMRKLTYDLAFARDLRDRARNASGH
jgi:N-acyl-D-aspartate/D-glutamate deacylase